MDNEQTIYICKLILCLGNKHLNNKNDKQEMWDIWIKFKNNLFENNDKIGINNILKSVYKLKNYDPKETLNKWGCIGDVHCLKSDVKILDKGDIYSPIQIMFKSNGYPPFKWYKNIYSQKVLF